MDCYRIFFLLEKTQQRMRKNHRRERREKGIVFERFDFLRRALTMFYVRWIEINDARLTNDGVLVACVLLDNVFERVRLSRDVLGRSSQTHVLPII